MQDPTLGLKVMAPVLRRGHCFRAWLDQYLHRHDGCQLIVVQAPAGYGKTVLLSQWRRTLMAGGAMAAWLTLDERDDEVRLLEGIVLSIRHSTGRHGFSLESGFSERDPDVSMKKISSMLSEWAALPQPLVLILDDFDRVTDPGAVWALDYLIRNLPANCRLFIGTRPIQGRASIVDLQSYGKAVVLNQRVLAFTLEEAVAFFSARFPHLQASGIFALIHRQTEGWPVGLEIACNRLDLARDRPAGALETLDFARDIRQFFIEKTAGQLSDWSREMLADIALLDQFNKDLCVAVTGSPEALDLIENLRGTSALITEVEGGIWFRFHQLALDHLRSQSESASPDRLQQVHFRAAKWFASHNFWDEAVRHAMAAGHEDLASDYTKRGLLSTLRAGKLDVVAQWLQRLPDGEIAESVDLRIVVARSLAAAGNARKATGLVADLLGSADEETRYKAALVCAIAAVHADDPDAAQRYLAQWPDKPPTSDAAWRLPYQGLRRWLIETSGSKERNEGAASWPVSITASGEAAFSECEAFHVKAVAFLNEGQPALALQLLEPVLARMESSLGRRSAVAVLLAATMAAAACELNDLAQARLLLLDRLDLIDPGLLPSACALGYMAVATLAQAAGQSNRALSVLETFHQRSRAQELPRNQALALGELVRLHTAAGRRRTSEDLRAELLQLAGHAGLQGSLRLPDIRLHALVAAARVSSLQGDLEAAHQALADARKLAHSMGRRRVEIEVRLMLAAVDVQRGRTVDPDFEDAVSTCAVLGLKRLLAEAHPSLHALLPQADGGGQGSAPAAPAGEGAGTPKVVASAMLTPREAQILELLVPGLSNKEIARCLDIGDGTIKWHLKNLFAKLGAVSRKTAVSRAKLLGLVSSD